MLFKKHTCYDCIAGEVEEGITEDSPRIGDCVAVQADSYNLPAMIDRCTGICRGKYV